MRHLRLLTRPSHRPVHGLVFDMDGTILDTRAYHMAAWRELVRRHGLTHDHYMVAENGFGKTNWAIFSEWYGDALTVAECDRLSEEKEEIFRELIKGKEKTRPGFVELLCFARRHGLRVALATSGPKANAEFLLEDTGVARFFDSVLWGDAAIRSKPHPEPFVKAALRMDVLPEHCVAFEDSHHGFRSALGAGMRLIGIAERRGDMRRIRRWTPFIFADFRRVPSLLLDWMS